MPRLNEFGDYCSGIGGGVVSINGKKVSTPAGSAHWYTNEWVICQECPFELCSVVAISKSSLTQKMDSDFWNATKKIILNQGANTIFAGGGFYAAWLYGVGLVTNNPTIPYLQDSYPGEVSAYGAIPVKLLYQSDGPWDVVEPNGQRWRLTESAAYNINIVAQGQATWTEHDLLPHAVGMPTPEVSGICYWLRYKNTWILYQDSEDYLILKPIQGKRGYRINHGNSFRPDFTFLSNNVVRIVWADDEGELSNQVKDKDLNDAFIDLWGNSVPVPGPTPLPTPPPEGKEIKMTPVEYITAIVEAGETIDQRFPNLRYSDVNAWMDKTVFLASKKVPNVGRKGRDPNTISKDTVGIAINPNDNSRFYAVSILRDDQPNVYNWRVNGNTQVGDKRPHDYGEVTGQFWEKAHPVDIGSDSNGTGGTTNPPSDIPPPNVGNVDWKQWSENVTNKLETIVKGQELQLALLRDMTVKFEAASKEVVDAIKKIKIW